MSVIAVEYLYDAARATELDELRPQHRAFLSELAAKGQNLASGPLLEVGEPRALLLLVADSPAAALELLEADPFFAAGLISDRTARAWNPVIGELAGR
ncbi:YciI family protein [Buchananella hordeovulneris]|uniref:YCII-related domain-containing protein n=1 Tax=Buchananella hordeovulneris TaxID=52770 RepID=A0A1Q5PXT8_9ACTO|nr:YciI family protein [Buchananella hordeovulneris]OKL52347.1 hypothetical protein BSZ40_02370 [Buchananella hordeovulneris]RRD45461.1 hypothetical protein EII13_00930 [Buchananella hordeovulneris]